MRAGRFRVARPTDDLEALRRFYVDGLGLKERGSFHGHSGYEGFMLGTESDEYELEFTTHVDGSPCPAPTTDNLLVFYLEDSVEVERIADRLRAIGSEPVEPENPYWNDHGLTFEDPDGWRIVLVDSRSL